MSRRLLPPPPPTFSSLPRKSPPPTTTPRSSSHPPTPLPFPSPSSPCIFFVFSFLFSFLLAGSLFVKMVLGMDADCWTLQSNLETVIGLSILLRCEFDGCFKFDQQNLSSVWLLLLSSVTSAVFAPPLRPVGGHSADPINQSTNPHRALTAKHQYSFFLFFYFYFWFY